MSWPLTASVEIPGAVVQGAAAEVASVHVVKIRSAAKNIYEQLQIRIKSVAVEYAVQVRRFVEPGKKGEEKFFNGFQSVILGLNRVSR